MTENSTLPTIAVLGGTGKEGKGLAYRWVKAGYRVIIGSRTQDKAERAARDLNAICAKELVGGQKNLSAAKEADIIVLTVPYSAHKLTLEEIKDAVQGKILVDVTVPLVPPKVTKVQMPQAGSAAQEAQKILGENANVVAAFQNISHEHLFDDAPINCDVLVTGKGKSARLKVLNLVEDAGMKGWDAGVIENAAVVEGMTSLLIYINKQNIVKSAGIKITGAESKTQEYRN
ncbi:MAG: NADPH-dependent F420 reductase [Anaerolineae bacterium]|jgi:8-hydroxy-5-deazaflavin:NADPH oxidoreductase|nr:NADPH-dependent F420 reductase [Anaerolineae bacterium]MBT7075229.1 NADPH-dependent F420 reductase [Anaerolineae bacterium]MBT7781842.1 NADPH-dependent F420 reductase [Anaerolineae bacterium]